MAEATEAAAKLAAENDVDLEELDGSGTDGKILIGDVEAAIEAQGAEEAEEAEEEEPTRGSGADDSGETPDGPVLNCSAVVEGLFVEKGTAVNDTHLPEHAIQRLRDAGYLDE